MKNTPQAFGLLLALAGVFFIPSSAFASTLLHSVCTSEFGQIWCPSSTGYFVPSTNTTWLSGTIELTGTTTPPVPITIKIVEASVGTKCSSSIFGVFSGKNILSFNLVGTGYASGTCDLQSGHSYYLTNESGVQNDYSAGSGIGVTLYDTSYNAGLVWNSAYTQLAVITGSTTVSINGAFNAAGLATSTLQSFCDSQLPYDNSSLTQATLTFIPNSLCKFGSFFLIPTTESINQFAQLASTTENRFPFSYIASVSNAVNALTASSTANSPEISLKLHDSGIGSTTALGNLLPNVIVFSSSTVQQYFPAGTFSTLKALAGIALLLTLIADIFFSTKKMMK